MKIRPEKKIQACTGFELMIPEFFSSLIFTTAQVVFVTTRVAFIFTSLSPVHLICFFIYSQSIDREAE